MVSEDVLSERSIREDFVQGLRQGTMALEKNGFKVLSYSAAVVDDPDYNGLHSDHKQKPEDALDDVAEKLKDIDRPVNAEIDPEDFSNLLTENSRNAKTSFLDSMYDNIRGDITIDHPETEDKYQGILSYVPSTSGGHFLVEDVGEEPPLEDRIKSALELHKLETK